MLIAIKGEINRNTISVFNTPLTSMDRSSGQKISKKTEALKNTLDQMQLIDIYRAFQLKAAEYLFFSSVFGIFFRIDHVLGQKTSLCKLRKTEIISSTFLTTKL